MLWQYLGRRPGEGFWQTHLSRLSRVWSLTSLWKESQTWASFTWRRFRLTQSHTCWKEGEYLCTQQAKQNNVYFVRGHLIESNVAALMNIIDILCISNLEINIKILFIYMLKLICQWLKFSSLRHGNFNIVYSFISCTVYLVTWL